MKAIEELSPQIGTSAACRSLGVPRATLYRHRRPSLPVPAVPRPKPPRALSEQERQQVLDVLDSEPFADKAPAEVYAALFIDPCTANERNGSPASRHSALDRPIIGHANINSRRGGSPITGDRPVSYGDVAQLGEHGLCKPGVGGSSPLVSTVSIRPTRQ